MKIFSFIDEGEALTFAMEHDSKDTDTSVEEEYDAAMEIVYEPTGDAEKKVIPIISANIIS